MLKNLLEIMNGGTEHAVHRLWSDQLTEPEAAAIQARTASDPKYRDDLDGLLAAFDSIEGLAGDPAVDEVIRDYQRLLHKRRSKVRVALGMAATLLVAVSATLTYLSISRGPDDGHLQKHFTRIGEQRTIELDDGSVVTLNTAGQLVVDYSGAMRRILLERGEAYFEV
ncbi:MAG: FecR domain-containing protein, partial [Gammaproteobacteria bacterium]|nr:FecR domain-containing protein [Gammaproteobacteria bacterium]